MNRWDDKAVEFSVLKGLTLTAINGGQKGSEEIEFVAEGGRRFKLLHYQDCCESVSVEDIIGDLQDLIGAPIYEAEVVSGGEELEPAEAATEYRDSSCTWTFYKLATERESVTIRWFGSSNGYYSESVDFVEVES